MNEPVHVFCDFDGTISRPDTLRVLTEELGAGPDYYAATGRLLRAGTWTLRDGIARDMASIGVPFAAAAEVLRARVTIDASLGRLAGWCVRHGVPLTVLSGGFEEIVDLFLVRAELAGVEVRANRLQAGTWVCIFRDESPAGHDKASALVEARARGRRTVLVGDGFSDQSAAEAADWVYAKGGLASWCLERGIACQQFETLGEVLASLQRRIASERRAGVA